MDEQPAATAPRDRAIEVRTRECEWCCVQWSAPLVGFMLICKERVDWIAPSEIDAWREAPHPLIGMPNGDAGSPPATNKRTSI